jgi:hypothetical protein
MGDSSGAIDERHATDLAFLVQTATQLLEKSDDQDIFQFIADKLYQIAEDGLVVVSEINPGKELTTRAVRGPDHLIAPIGKIFGRPSESFRVSISDEVEAALLQGRLFVYEEGLNDLSKNALLPHLCRYVVGLIEI